MHFLCRVRHAQILDAIHHVLLLTETPQQTAVPSSAVLVIGHFKLLLEMEGSIRNVLPMGHSRYVYHVNKSESVNLSTSSMIFFLLLTSSNYCSVDQLVICGSGHFELQVLLGDKSQKGDVGATIHSTNCPAYARMFACCHIFKLYFDLFICTVQNTEWLQSSTSFSH